MIIRSICIFMICIVSVYGDSTQATQAKGTLRIHPDNPRYFTDGTKNDDGTLNVVYLTGSHTWNNLVDMGKNDPPELFDFDAYLEFLQRYNHNFIRLWTWDSFAWDTRANGRHGKDFVHHCAPLPWARTGPGKALDGKPKFDLSKFNPNYFERLRKRVIKAGERGIYVSVMLFEGWGLRHGNRNRANAPDGWAYRSHPFHPDNNIKGITGDLNGDGHVLEVHSLDNPDITPLQKAYIHKVIDTVNDLDNVLFEVANEGGEKEWNWWVVNTVHEYEKTKPKQHPVGITGHGGENTKCWPVLRIGYPREVGMVIVIQCRNGTKTRLAYWTPIIFGGLGEIMFGYGAVFFADTIPFSWIPMMEAFLEITSIPNSNRCASIWDTHCSSPIK